jgi:SAM-dependent methyltransferase
MSNRGATVLTSDESPCSSWVLRFLPLIRQGGLVLDLAAGSGRHTRLLLGRGYQVRAVDRDVTALDPLSGPKCLVEAVDLEAVSGWQLGGGYDGIVITNYLHRPLLPAFVQALAPGGVVVYETYMVGNERLRRPRNPEFLLRPGELLEAFAALSIVAFEQGEVSQPYPAIIQRIAAINGPLPVLP